MTNIYPDKYRGVSVTRVDGPLDSDSLRTHFVGRKAYVKTRYAVVSSGPHNDRPDDGAGAGPTAVIKIHTAAPADEDQLFVEITDVTVLANADETVVVHAPDLDTGIPSELARAAREWGGGARAVVVHGRYEHISFIIDADPIRLVVREVVPPEPAKLVDQATRILAVREDLPPVELVPDVVDLRALAAAHPSAEYLLPCRGSGFEPEGAEVRYLDEHPAERDWLLLGCTRSQQIHGEFYHRDAPRVSFCPRERPAGPTPTLTKCCLQDDEIVEGAGWVSVPWGSSLERVGEALDRLVALADPAGDV